MNPKTHLQLLYLLPILLTLMGIFMIYEASSITAARVYGDSLYFVKNQVIWFFLSLIVLAFFSKFDYHRLYQLALPLLIANLVLLLLVFVPGLYTNVLGAKRWLRLGPITVQPSEMTKLSLIVYLSAWFSYKERDRFFAFLILTGCIITLVMFQPNLGTAALLGSSALFLYIISGAPLQHILFLIPAATAAALALALTSAYRMRRIMTFLNPSLDPQGIGYHISQVNTSLSLGGIFGTGFGASKQKFQFLPEAHTDSIFAIIGENFGFIGGTLIIIVYITILFLLYRNLFAAKDRLGFLLAAGVFFLFGVQVLVNLGAMVQLIPLTGIPLPFLSYGGSSLLTYYALFGIAINIYLNHEQKRTSTARRNRR
ncbi:stage V sporulation protein E [Candidatus Roizmanbacteria bacterium CG10_big_fil_rev_8_21_14_0_10_45_7]|uniref:Probable peptidoglycan glycosyltransferase FtsW n=1 Tax=Candidatus Roizmanbacteria bacterium CG10_big_fil_rev_8_21_14_0_10_45_7 TaxID=1974854 RepID=A0A2M8KV08_9BACT|nr:MAG: stage V sporulation protein E [Candidatus Roizmanbacteria bacterium CG10_big_fil_rev_8_21_14_0_10_45_7]